MQDATGKNTGDNIINHDTKTTMHFTIDGTDRPWFNDVEQSKQSKPKCHINE